MADKLGLDNETRVLKLGKSFDKNGPVAFHSIRYDFKPASVDISKVSGVEIGESHSVTVTVPHVEGSGTSHTIYKGNKRPCPKECVLIIDHNTGEITLEKLANTIQLKKTRSEKPEQPAKVPQQTSRPITPSEPKTATPRKKQPVSTLSTVTHSSAPSLPMNAPLLSAAPLNPSPKHVTGDSSSNSSSSGSDSSSSDDDDDKQHHKMAAPSSAPAPAPAPHHPHKLFSLSEDLRLSDSGSDTD